MWRPILFHCNHIAITFIYFTESTTCFIPLKCFLETNTPCKRFFCRMHFYHNTVIQELHEIISLCIIGNHQGTQVLLQQRCFMLKPKKITQGQIAYSLFPRVVAGMATCSQRETTIKSCQVFIFSAWSRILFRSILPQTKPIVFR